MPLFTTEVGVVMERRKAKSKWIDVIWEAHTVLPVPTGADRGTYLGLTSDGELFYAGSLQLEAHTKETSSYRTNLMGAKPQIWVVFRTQPDDAIPEIIKVTVDPHEGEAFSQTGWDMVHVVPMPDIIEAALNGFIEAHHVDEVFYKRKRNRADPEALAPGLNGPDKDRAMRAAGKFIADERS
jgi:hypothetical protein